MKLREASRTVFLWIFVWHRSNALSTVPATLRLKKFGMLCDSRHYLEPDSHPDCLNLRYSPTTHNQLALNTSLCKRLPLLFSYILDLALLFWCRWLLAMNLRFLTYVCLLRGLLLKIFFSWRLSHASRLLHSICLISKRRILCQHLRRMYYDSRWLSQSNLAILWPNDISLILMCHLVGFLYPIPISAVFYLRSLELILLTFLWHEPKCYRRQV